MTVDHINERLGLINQVKELLLPTDQPASQTYQTKQMAQLVPPVQMDQIGFLSKMPTEIILLIYKSLYSFTDLRALIETSRRFHQIWLLNVSAITKALLPTTTDYLELAEDYLAVEDLLDLDIRRGTYKKLTYEKIFLTGILAFLNRKRDLIRTHCDTVNDTPVAEFLQQVNWKVCVVASKLEMLDKKVLIEEAAVMMESKSLANLFPLRHARRLIAIEKKMQERCESFSEGMLRCIGKALPLHPAKLSKEETDRFMKAIYRFKILQMSKTLRDIVLTQAIHAAVQAPLCADEESQLAIAGSWDFFVWLFRGKYKAKDAATHSVGGGRWKYDDEVPCNELTCGSENGPTYHFTKDKLFVMVDDEWRSDLIADEFDDQEVTDDDQTEEDDDDTSTQDADDEYSEWSRVSVVIEKCPGEIVIFGLPPANFCRSETTKAAKEGGEM